MNELMIFEGNQVEVFEFDGEVLFNPYHIGRCLNLSDSAVKMAIGKMTEKQVIKMTNSKVKDIDFRKLHNTGENFLTESGVYKLAFKSQKEEAERFTDWIADEVLPAIRKHGGYLTPQKIEEVLLNPDTIIALAQNLKAEQEKNKVLTEKVEQQQEQLQLQQPAVEFTEQIRCAENSTTIGTLAKIMSKKGINIGRNQLFEWLRNSGYLIKQKGRDYNKPKQPMIVYGYMEVKTSTHEDERPGKIYYNNTPLVTGKGIIYLIKKYREYIEKITLPHATI